MMRILIADEDSLTCRLLETLLTKWGYEVIIAHDGNQAWQILQEKESPKLAILDWMMPGLDGIEICRRARQRIEAPYIYIMLMTSKIRKEDLFEGMDSGADDYLAKPFDRQELDVRLRAGLRILDLQEALLVSSEDLALSRLQEKEMGTRLRQILLTAQPPAFLPGLEAAALTEPGGRLEGAFYDFYPQNEHILDIAMGEVMGQGQMAALIAAATKTHFLRVLHRAALSGNGEPISPAEIVTQVHDSVAGQFLGQNLFETLCYVRFDSTARQMDFVDCGFPPTVHCEKATGICRLLHGDNMPLGIGQHETYRQMSVPLAQGDLFLFHSDGITEAQNPRGEPFGSDRLLALIQEGNVLAPEALIAHIHAAVKEFAAVPLTAHLTSIAVLVT